MLEIDIQELLDAVGGDEHVCDEGLTTEEWAKALVVSVHRMRKIIQRGLKTKILHRGFRMDVEHWSGKPQKFTVYQVVRENKDSFV